MMATLLGSLAHQVDPRVAIGCLALAALIVVARTIVSIVKIRVSRSPLARMADALAKFAKKDPGQATRFFLQIQAGDKAKALTHEELSDMLQDTTADSQQVDTQGSPTSIIHPLDQDTNGSIQLSENSHPGTGDKNPTEAA